MNIQPEHATEAGGATRRERLLTWGELRDLVPYSRQHVGRLEAAGSFPRRLQIGPGRVAWRASEVCAWLGGRRRGALRPWGGEGRHRAETTGRESVR